jgi:hypothetical protein
MEDAGNHPSVAAIVAGAHCHQHAGAEKVGVAIGQHHSHRSSRGFHEGRELDARTDCELVPGVGLFGGEDGEGHRAIRYSLFA